MAIVYVAPKAIGLGDGTGASDAMAFDALDLAIERAEPGGLVQFLDGLYKRKQLPVTKGGVRYSPVTLQAPTGASFESTRDPSWSAGDVAGQPVFVLSAGASWLTWQGFTIRNCGNGAWRTVSDLDGLIFDNFKIINAMRGFEVLQTIRGLAIKNGSVHGYSKGAIRIDGDTNDFVIDNVYGDSQFLDGDNFAIGVQLQGTAHNGIIRLASMNNARDTLHPYWNGDGFSAERGTYNVRYEFCFAQNNTDAGFDIKTYEATLLGCYAEGNKRNYRFWNPVTVVECNAVNPLSRGGIGPPCQVQATENAEVRLVGGSYDEYDPSIDKYLIDDGASIDEYV